jgi:hypothetical protein
MRRGSKRADTPAGGLLSGAWWLHPMLFAAFPVLFLFADNIGEHVSVEPLYEPLGMALGGAAIAVALAAAAGRLIGTAARLALAATIVIVLFFTYGYAWSAVGDSLGLHRYLLAGWGLLAMVGVGVSIGLDLRLVGRTTAALNLIGLLLVAMNVVPIVDFGLRQTTRGPDLGAGPELDAPGGGPSRDVWYLIFDRYAGQEALERVYGYDNTQFLDELRDRGFHIVEHSTANYLKTAHSLASSLNMEYLDVERLAQAAATPDDWRPLYEMLQGSYAVERFLREHGYRYVHLGLRRGATYTNSQADQVLLYGDQSEFSAVLADTTLLVSLENLLGDEAPGTLTLYRNQTLFQLDRMSELARTGGPKFVFAHLMLPHPPYIFNPDGSPVTPEQAATTTAHERYLNQVRFANRSILELLDILLEGAEDEWPIVIIQSDEGPFPARYQDDEVAFEWLEATDDELLEKFSILNAILLPGVTPSDAGLQPTLTPVNDYRVVFNTA